MTWTSPMTAVANQVWTAAEYNLYVRDNLLETMSAKAATVGSMFVADTNGLLVERAAASATVATEEVTTSASYTDLATVGPAVTVTTGTSALIWWTATQSNTSVDFASVQCSFTVSGATTVASSDNRCVWYDGHSASNNRMRYGASAMMTILNPGVNTFTMTYKAFTAGQNATFSDREIVVLPL